MVLKTSLPEKAELTDPAGARDHDQRQQGCARVQTEEGEPHYVAGRRLLEGSQRHGQAQHSELYLPPERKHRLVEMVALLWGRGLRPCARTPRQCSCVIAQ